ncbi:hypothetical protein [Nonlabens spongiae]|uniref:hypothetical protein n=1 Tax=Nonlabens spongiae TaxID=331648 RepID=UPI001FE56EF4|nr:hypothetical protein [Nonlabens spongiae]
MVSGLTFAQDYLDIASLNISQTNMEDLDQTFNRNDTNLNLEVLYPIALSNDIVLITGFTAENTRLELRN